MVFGIGVPSGALSDCRSLRNGCPARSLAMNQAQRLVRRTPVAVVDTEYLPQILCRIPGSGAARPLSYLGVRSEKLETQPRAGGGTPAEE
jgi:hypothetical protein